MTLEEKYEALKQSHQEVVDDYNAMNGFCRLLNLQLLTLQGEFDRLQKKIKAANDIVEASYHLDLDNFPHLHSFIKKYKSL